MPFTKGQYVRMLVASMGGDADDVEQTYPPGAAGYIDDIDERGIHHVVVGTGDQSITQCFDAGDEAERSMQALDLPRLRADPVAFSSVVGCSVMLTDAAGQCVGLLGLMQIAGGRAEMEAMAARVADAINFTQGRFPTQHVKRGTTYAILGGADLQISQKADGSPGTARTLKDGDNLVVYRADADGKLYARHPDEFVGTVRFKDPRL